MGIEVEQKGEQGLEPPDSHSWVMGDGGGFLKESRYTEQRHIINAGEAKVLSLPLFLPPALCFLICGMGVIIGPGH